MDRWSHSRRARGYTKEDLTKFMENAFNGSWQPREKKDAFIRQLHGYTG
jgi:adenosine deaminase